MAARPATRTTRERRVDSPQPRPAVRDLSRGPASFRIDWDVRPAFDFVFSLWDDAGETEDLPAEDRKWLAESKAAMPPDVAAKFNPLFEAGICTHVAVIAVDRPKVRTASDLVAAVAATPSREVILGIFEEGSEEPGLRDLVARALDGDETVMPAIAKTMPDYKRDARLQVLREPDRTARDLVDILTYWADVFTPIEPRITEIIERDYALRAVDRETLAPADLIERTTGGIRWLPESGVRRVILAPSYFSRPYNFLMNSADWRLFGYPVSDDALEAGDPLAAPQSVVRLHRALGDETRLRILKLLAGRDLYLTEIAQQLDLSKPTIKHHLALLRSAGLVTITESGTVIYYSLRRNRLDDASADIKRFLIG
ncbi:MAG: ArsR/SmtB family transcription factor [Chloroflexota bacterium]